MELQRMNPCWVFMVGGSSLSASLSHTKVRVPAAPAGLVAGAAAAVGSAAGAPPAGAAGAEVGEAWGAGGQAARIPPPVAIAANCRNFRRLIDPIVDSFLLSIC